jgi:hypothetical protein
MKYHRKYMIYNQFIKKLMRNSVKDLKKNKNVM